MNELIKINKENNTCNARDLWVFLKSKQQFGNWIKKKIKKYNFKKDIDFFIKDEFVCDKTAFGNKRKITNYYLLENTYDILLKIEKGFYPSIEKQYISIIQNTFLHFKSEKQFTIGSYFIDLYLPDLKVGIECNEFDHKYYDKRSENIRRNFIRNNDIKLIEFNPCKENFNIGNVINKIIREIYN